jgi:hypothetical protein
MKTTHSILRHGACALVAALCFAQLEWSANAGGSLCAQAGLVQDAVGSDPDRASKAITQLRANGQIGLDALFAAHQAEIKRLRESRAQDTMGSKARRTPLEEVIDQVSQQRDGLYSQLYWYTDLEAAKQMSKATGKPILSLRLLGKLSDEFSCANSRYFRTILYSDQTVADVLRTQFVLHWESERPVPRITIDFGDGRKLERTVTGNSIHYVVDSDGMVIDAIPGLFAAKTFLQKLDSAGTIAKKVISLSQDERAIALESYHAEQLDNTLSRWAGDLLTLGVPLSTDSTVKAAYSGKRPDLDQKRDVLELSTTEETIAKIAQARQSELSIGATARLAIASKIAAEGASAEKASRVAVSKAIQETPLLRAMRNLQNSLARDTVRNDYLLHTRIHGWLGSGRVSTRLNDLNQVIYAELFLTPRTDPWLGLEAPDGFAALENDGRVLATSTKAQP